VADSEVMDLAVSRTHLPLVEAEGAGDEVARLYARFYTTFGRPDVPGILKCFATHPPLLEHMMALSAAVIFTDGALDRRQKEMIATLVSARNECAYCTDSHAFALRVHGGSREALCAILDSGQENWLDSTSLSGAEQALLRFVGKVNAASHEIGKADIDVLHAAGWSDLEISEAVHVAALFAMFNRVVNAFGLPSQGLLEMYESSPDKDESAIRSRVLRPRVDGGV
jgi:uncharacterized peroxidase-related enzyme